MEVLSKYNLTPRDLFIAVKRNIWDLIPGSSDDMKPILIDIAADEDRKRELFRMGPEFIKESYGRMKSRGSEETKKLPDGIFEHPENIEFLSYYGLALNNPEIGSTNRAFVVRGIEDLPSSLQFYLDQIGLAGLMVHGFKAGEKHSPLAVIKALDRAYQKITGDPFSLFDTSQDARVRRFDKVDNRIDPGRYIAAIIYKDNGLPYGRALSRSGIKPNDFFRAVTRDLEYYIDFADGHAKQILREIASGRNRKRDLLRMDEEFMLEQYRRVMGEIPGEHQGNFYRGTYNHSENRELLAYCALTYYNPKLASANRAEVVQGIEDLPENLQKYFNSIGLGSLMKLASKEKRGNAIRYVLELFNKVYQRKIQDPFSLFDETRGYHLEFSSKRGIGVWYTLIRHEK